MSEQIFTMRFLSGYLWNGPDVVGEREEWRGEGVRKGQPLAANG